MELQIQTTKKKSPAKNNISSSYPLDMNKKYFSRQTEAEEIYKHKRPTIPEMLKEYFLN